MNIPNSLTLLRVLLIPVFIPVFYLPFGWSNEAATAIFAIAAVTDWLDGFLARRLGQTSRLGAFLDPVADKLMVATVLVLLVQRNPSVWLAVPALIIIGREIAISALREWMAGIGASQRVAVSLMGKIKTTAQMAALLLLLYDEPLGPIPTFEVGLACLFIAAGLTIWSMFCYLFAAWPDLRSG
ncbi:MAG: CDP-diacylglycerol--glycerol-3-phosphate 3-phosphatidyltransferase [Gammaproteobacteria bacterium]|nr:MAG: CDP-diacylglycerol--glycerol-3-phosphate 3-phosphatidyltransferase [Gammaproteobacteria bacterium]